MSPALNRSSALQHFERSSAVEIRNRIMFNFYPGLPQVECEEKGERLILKRHVLVTVCGSDPTNMSAAFTSFCVKHE